MKKFFKLFLFLLIINDCAFASWVAISNFPGGKREITSYFSINVDGYVGSGRNSGTEYNDLWKFNVQGVWTQLNPYPGNGLVSPANFVIADSAYIVCGYGYGLPHNSVWCYNSLTNSWSAKNNFPGTSRYSTVGFSINDFGYILTGWNGVVLNDFWKYNPSSNTWVQQAGYTGNSTVNNWNTSAFSIGSTGYVVKGNLTELYKFTNSQF